MAPVIALARSEATKTAKFRDFVERRQAFQQRARARPRPFRQHGLDGGVGTRGDAAEDFAGVRCRHGVGNRIWPQANDANILIPLLLE
jgi:hypothetical protein